MDNLRRFIKECAAAGAVSAGAIAANPWGGGGTTISRKKARKSKLPVAVKRTPMQRVRTSESFLQQLLEFDVDPDFDPADVVSRLKSTEKKSEMDDQDTIAFGLEDANGNVVKVYVRNDQASEFEKALQQILHGEQDTEKFDGDAGEVPEVAEVLYNLKDKFDIIDVVWPDSEEDEEEQATAGVEGEAGAEGPGEGGDETDLTLDMPTGDEEGGDEDMLAGDEGEMGMGDLGGEESALQQMIKMMQSKAEADKAEAEAKKAEAEAEKAKWAAQAAESKLKQEEKVLDMEAYYKNKKSMDDETKQLAKLAKWQHDMTQDVAGDGLGYAEEEEEQVIKDINTAKPAQATAGMVPQAQPIAKLTTAEVVDELYKRLKVQA